MLLNKFKTKKVETTVTVGEYLKRKREELGISIKDLGNKLNIKDSYLEDLEKNNYEKLPPDVYVKGFIKSYSELVGFNSERMIKLFIKEKEIEDKIENRNKKKKKYKKKFAIKKYIVITPKIVTIFLSLVILSVVGYYFWHQLSSFNSKPFLFVSSPLVDEITSDSEIIVSGETEIGIILKINGEDVFVDESGYFKESVMLHSGKNVIIIKVVNRFDKTVTEIRNVIYEKKLKPMPIDNLQL
ncbi:helix-turn-helix domain-containing protein [Candidatus Parcubacteria bacterium]|nr:helix-turn-helix domain-containing protein [Candidatus Parcubacteria bacterium]